MPCPSGSFCPLNSQPILCPFGSFCPPGSVASIACPLGTWNRNRGSSSPTDCLPCLVGHYCQLMAAAPILCPAGLAEFRVSSHCACLLGPAGTFAAGTRNSSCNLCTPSFIAAQPGSSSCSPCSSAQICPVGCATPLDSNTATQLTTASAASFSANSNSNSNSPLDAYLSSQSNRAQNSQIIVVLIALGFVVLLSLLYALIRKQPWIKQCLRGADRLYDWSHFVQLDQPILRRQRAIGGFFTIVVGIIMATLIVLSVIQFELSTSFTQAVSPKSPPFPPTGTFSFGLQLFAAPSCFNVSISGPDCFSLVGYATSKTQITAASVSASWTCADCQLATHTFGVSFNFTDYNCYSGGFSYSLTLPAFRSESGDTATDNFMMNGWVAPRPALWTVFSGPQATVLTISLVPTAIRVSPVLVGSFASLSSVQYGSQVAASSSATPQQGLTVTFEVSVSQLLFEVVPVPQSPLLLLAQIFSLLGTVVVFGRIAMHVAERQCTRKYRSGSKSNAQADSLAQAGTPAALESPSHSESSPQSAATVSSSARPKSKTKRQRLRRDQDQEQADQEHEPESAQKQPAAEVEVEMSETGDRSQQDESV